MHYTNTAPDAYTSQDLQEGKERKVLSKLDAVKAYWHIALAEKSRYLTAFNTESHGLLQYARLPMGMTDSAASFQKAIEHCLQGIDNVAPYIDDILVWGADQAEHDAALYKVVERLNRDGFRLSAKKCKLSRTQLTMPGQRLTVTESGLDMQPDPSRTTDLREAPAPRNLKEIHRFLGMATYFSPYIPHFATIAEPLFRLKRKGIKFEWTTECEAAFQEIKSKVTQPEVLVPYDPECPVHVQTDASCVGLGACLMIERAGKLRLLCSTVTTLLLL